MSFPFNITNPGIYIDGLLTSAERTFVTDLYAASAGASEGEVLTWTSGAPSWEPNAAGGYTNLTQFVAQTAWRVFYSNGSGDVTELALGADGTYLRSNGAALAPTFDTPSGASGITRTVVVTSGSATMGSTASTDYTYLVAGAHTMSLPAASGNTNRYTVKNNHSANITIDTAGAETVEGAASISIAPEESVDIISDGTNFRII